MSDTLLTAVWIGYAAILGLLIGSFLNVCIYRLPAKITIVKGHSFCPNCKHPLSTLDLFPVFSYLLLDRKCRYCHEPISSRYMKIELLTGAYFALAAWCLRPGQVSLPVWLQLMPGSDFAASLILTAAAALTFCALLVWAMIIWDLGTVPAGLFIFAITPVIIRLALQPELILTHLLTFLLSLPIMLFLSLVKLMPSSTIRERVQLGAGLSTLALMCGLIASIPVLLISLIELTIVVILSQRSDMTGQKQAGLLWRSLPLQTLLWGSIGWLLF